MIKANFKLVLGAILLLVFIISMLPLNVPALPQADDSQIGREVSVPVHLQDGEEFSLSIRQLIAFGKKLFEANWTVQEGGGRPHSKGTANGEPLSDPTDPLVFPRNFNRVSSPDMNSCSGCHNKPEIGGGGEFGTLVFVLGQRFDFATFDGNETISTKGTLDERGLPTTLQTMSDGRKTVAMHGSGFIEMLARQITADLQAIRDACAPGQSCALISKGISYGTIVHNPDGTWNTSQVQGIAAPSLVTNGSTPPSLVIRPFHQTGNVISIRQFSNNAFNHHHGIQSEERFGLGVDKDGDGFVNELTRADMTAVSIFQATLPVPGRVISSDPPVRAAIINGEQKFAQIGCANCHMPSLPLNNQGWIYSEPNSYNPPGNLRPGDAPPMTVDLTSDDLPPPRLKPVNGVVYVPAYTDLKLHDITTGPGDPNCEPCDQNQPAGSPGFFAGNCKFLTRKLWGIANQHPFMHHGTFTTIREAVQAHHGEAEFSGTMFSGLSKYDQDSVIEFLKSLQILTPQRLNDDSATGVTVLRAHRSLCVDENNRDVPCPAGVQP
jgi:hypothetical protein